MTLSSVIWLPVALVIFAVPNVQPTIRLAWLLKLAGQNLLGSHMETGTDPSPANVIGRSAYGAIQWAF